MKTVTPIARLFRASQFPSRFNLANQESHP
jgi:hypothetical protein